MIRAASTHILKIFGFVEHVLSLIFGGEGDTGK
jgi:hypothetical protein